MAVIDLIIIQLSYMSPSNFIISVKLLNPISRL